MDMLEVPVDCGVVGADGFDKVSREIVVLPIAEDLTFVIGCPMEVRLYVLIEKAEVSVKDAFVKSTLAVEKLMSEVEIGNASLDVVKFVDAEMEDMLHKLTGNNVSLAGGNDRFNVFTKCSKSCYIFSLNSLRIDEKPFYE